VTIYGRDVNDHVVLSAFDVDSLFFLGAADLQIADFSLPEEGVFIGPQYDISWTFINAGGTPVVLDSVLVMALKGSYEGRNPVPVRRTLGQGVSHTGQTTLSVNINSATGRDSLWLAAYVTNTRTGIQDLIVFAGQKESWVIEGNGEVRIDFVSVPQRLVSRGQTDIPVRVSLTNTGNILARVDSIEVLPLYAPGINAPILRLAGGREIPVGDQQIFDFQLGIGTMGPNWVKWKLTPAFGAKPRPQDRISAILGPCNWLTIEVQERPFLIASKLNFPAPTVNANQNFSATLNLSAHRGEFGTAAAILDSVSSCSSTGMH
jgi:hypothetical protein